MRGSSFPKASARKARTSASTSAGSARTPATSPATTPNEQLPTTSPGCATATTASRGLEAINGRLEHPRSSAFGFGNLTCYIAHRFWKAVATMLPFERLAQWAGPVPVKLDETSGGLIYPCGLL